ncbi:ABC transporter substrate-binding protein [Nitratidesulfovibrio sp. SRB-5]|uniref:Extracellular solute-binding protein family 1 n=1 Tax=Nitratidesulfovibrio vulgaris (strain DSM 19637 / Miyazaki F) TaxID=883 RepID=B8DRZ5_NITV9|nr:ABC transporter substrate-binding protein [Nitratidesulfovibrio sp. SRB-5]MBZ2172257.1 ABC transporter substrate-binding protein [Nitratidesulfovibrio sp. SRB-5]RXF77218.1 extracellular solute-binding protein [Desulfovibrio sp. DS-1]
MSRRTTALLVALLGVAMLFGATGQAFAKQKFIVYTSMKESLIGTLKDAFVKQHPDIDMDYQSSGAGKIMAKIAAERESGKILADVLWTSEVPDFYQMKAQGLLDPYVSPEVKNILNPIADYDGSFTPARLGTLGIAYNTRYVKQAPTSWQDLMKPEYKGAFGIANPALSGTSYMSVAMLEKAFGWEFFKKLRANGAKMGKGSGQVVDDTSSGDLVASLAVDYITNDKIEKGATIALVYPQEMLVIPSPVAIIKGSPNVEAARKFVDFLLSREGQAIIAGEGTLPVRADVEVPARFKLPTPADAVKRAIKVDYPQMIAEKEDRVKTFTDIMQSK